MVVGTALKSNITKPEVLVYHSQVLLPIRGLTQKKRQNHFHIVSIKILDTNFIPIP